MPALPLDEAGKYVAAAYVVFLTLIIVYVAIMAAKVQRMERDLRELAELAEERNAAADAPGRGSEGQSIPASSGRGAEHAGGS